MFSRNNTCMDYKNDIKLDRNNFNKIVKINSKLRYIAYTGGIEYQVVTGKVQGKRDRGRQRQTFLGWLGKCLDRRGVDIIHLAENRTLYHAVTSNVSI